ncbi:hypothetical protein BaRGS_00031251, partial [Batillaria attramentaria]
SRADSSLMNSRSMPITYQARRLSPQHPRQVSPGPKGWAGSIADPSPLFFFSRYESHVLGDEREALAPIQGHESVKEARLTAPLSSDGHCQIAGVWG